MIKYDEFLIDGDYKTNKGMEGIIKITNSTIVLTGPSIPNSPIILLKLPPVYEV